MKIIIKKILTEDSELMTKIRNDLHLKLKVSDANGKKVEQLTKTPSPHEYDKPESSIEESVVMTKLKHLNSGTIANKSASQALSKLGLANVEAGSKAVQNSPVISLKRQASAAQGTLQESTDPNFGKVTKSDMKLIGTKTQSELREEGVAARNKNNNIRKGLEASHYNMATGPGHLDKPGIAMLKVGTLSDEQIQRRLKYRNS